MDPQLHYRVPLLARRALKPSADKQREWQSKFPDDPRASSARTLGHSTCGQITLGLHAHQDYLSRRGTPRNLADLAHHALIGFDETTPFIRDAGKTFSLWRREAFSMRTDNNLAQLALIRSGAGIGVCQTVIARRDDQIMRILPKQVAQPLEIWITMHQDLRNSPRCRVTFDALVEGLQQYVDSQLK